MSFLEAEEEEEKRTLNLALQTLKSRCRGNRVANVVVVVVVVADSVAAVVAVASIVVVVDSGSQLVVVAFHHQRPVIPFVDCLVDSTFVAVASFFAVG